MPFRSGLLVAALCAGCATAGRSTQRPPGDAAGQADAPSRRPDAPPGRDAAPPDGNVLPPDSGSGGPCSYSGVLATWDLSALTGANTSAPATSTQGGVTAGALSLSSGLTSVSANGCIDAKNWPTGQLDTTKYFTLSITPPAGCSLALSSMTINGLASAQGPASAAVGTSADSFGQTTAVSTSQPSTPTLSVTGATAPVEVRIYGYGAVSTAGTLRLQNTLTVTGSLN